MIHTSGTKRNPGMGDLGFGVEYRRKGDILRILSRQIPLPWQSSGPGARGTAVHFEDEIWEADFLGNKNQGELWELKPWPAGEVIRRQEILNPEYLKALVDGIYRHNKHQRQGIFLLLLMPFTGLLPESTQKDIEDNFGIQGDRATMLSALPELLGAPVAIRLVSGSGEPPFPVLLILFFGFYFSLQGLFRFGYGLGLQRACGSILTLPLALFLRLRGDSGNDNHGPGIKSIVLRFALLGFAPGAIQEKLCAELGLAPRFLTRLSAIAEVFGGGINLCIRGTEDPFYWLSIFFVVEGLFRIVLTILKMRPNGSLLGLPFAPLYRKWLNESRKPKI